MLNTKNNTFPKNARLNTKKQYSNVFNKPQVFRGKYWIVLVKDTGKDLARLGLAISKKTIKKSVVRNIYKRVAREVFRKNRVTLKNLDIVIIAKRYCKGRELLNTELQEILNNIRIPK